jgi:acetylornithine deacetylase/succinyl-diaminopimelate desuccinylase-like protein
LAEQILLPAINLRGISSGHVGEKAAAAIPADARASIDFRLVPDLTPDRVRAIVEEHIRKQGYYITNVDPDMSTRLTHSMIVKLVWGAGYPATRTPADPIHERRRDGTNEDLRGVTHSPSSTILQNKFTSFI